MCRHSCVGSQASNSSHQHAKPIAHLLIEQATYEEFIEIMREEARYVVRQLLRQSLSAARGYCDCAACTPVPVPMPR